MTRVGIAGIGFMGMIHYQAYKRLNHAQVTAIATRDPAKRAGDWRAIQGNFGPPGKLEDLAGVSAYATAEELIADPNVDLVDLCVPNDQHAEWAIRALQAGKHVIVEKAIALTLDEADAMLAAARESGKHLLVAHVLPFFPDFGWAWRTIAAGTYGGLQAAHFRRHISPPNWSDAMKNMQATGGGPIVDLHIHDTHFVNLLAGTPEAVLSRGHRMGGPTGPIDYVSTQYLYPAGGPAISATSGAISQGSRPFTHGFEIYLERATMFYEAGQPLKLYTADGVTHPDLGGGDEIDAFAAELGHALAVLNGIRPADVLDATLARNALALCLKELESVETGAVVAVR